MAIGGSVEQFDVWLCDKLEAFETDESVFSSYIRGILEGEDSHDEKTEALESILSEITENDVAKLSQEILEKWNFFNSTGDPDSGSVLKVAEDVDVKLARLMESQARATTVRSNEYTDEEKRIREAILKQYGQYSDEEGEEGENISGAGAATAVKSNSTSTSTVKVGLERNNNAALVAQAVREKREQSKIESQKKKDKDKEDREKQKQLQADKKEKRKTQKGERRR